MNYQGKINVYTCPAGHKTITRDVDNGTTPMIINCKATLLETFCSCDKHAHSAWYNCDQTLTPLYEWYKPGPEEKIKKHDVEHVKLGGLLLRRIGEQPKCQPTPVFL
jgi:hypothetical protein